MIADLEVLKRFSAVELRCRRLAVSTPAGCDSLAKGVTFQTFRDSSAVRVNAPINLINETVGLTSISDVFFL
jgi:hypothetical protein